MGGHVVIERLEFHSRCGVTPEERARPQSLALDLELDCLLEAAGLSDDLVHTIDYAKVAQRVVDIGTLQESQLLETLAERLMAALFDEFSIDHIKLWLRKLHPPISYVTRSVGISIERTRLAQHVLRQIRHRPSFSPNNSIVFLKARSSMWPPVADVTHCSSPRWATRSTLLIETNRPSHGF